jgi:hypothetical protein
MLLLAICVLIGCTAHLWFKYHLVGIILGVHLLMLFGVIGFMTFVCYCMGMGPWAFLVVPGAWFLFYLYCESKRPRPYKSWDELTERERKIRQEERLRLNVDWQRNQRMLTK